MQRPTETRLSPAVTGELPQDPAAEPRSPALELKALSAQLTSTPEQWALFLDVDGTLLDIAATPEGVVVDPGLPALLTALQRQLGGALALVSGRPVAQLDQLFSPARLALAGLHGAEWRDADGRLQRMAVDEALQQRVRLEAATVAGDLPGVRLEDKGIAIALHWRQAPTVEAALRQRVEAIAARTGMMVQPGKCVFELKPPGVDKGVALRRLLAAPPFRGRRPVFVGDDLTDAFAMAAARAEGGVAIAVGETLVDAAEFMLPEPAAVRCWLQQWRDALDRRDDIAPRSTEPPTARNGTIR